MKRLRDTLWLVVRLGLAVAVMVWLLWKMGSGQMGDALRDAAGNWPWLLAAFVVCLPALFLCVLRWKSILDAQDMRLTWTKVGSIFFIGMFFNSFMIGATGGDLIKAYYIARETHHRKTEAVTSILIDRVAGMLALSLLVTGMILVRWTFFMGHAQTRVAGLAALGVCGAILAGGVLIFGVHLFDVFPFLRRWTAHPVLGKPFNLIEKAYNAFYVCRAQPRVLAAIMIQSLALQMLFVVAGACVGRGLGLALPWFDYLTLSPLVGLIGAIPITPGGLGIREGASIQLWAVLGVPASKALLLALLPYLILVLWGLPGGLLFLFHRAGSGQALRDELNRAAETGDETDRA